MQKLANAIKWAKKNYPHKGFRVKAQEDGPTIVSVKGDEEVGRTVVFLKEKKNAVD